MQQNILIIGANSAIAQSLTQLHLNQGDMVYAVSRFLEKNPTPVNDKLHWITTDHNEHNVKEIMERLLEIGDFHRIYLCLGILHNEDFMPEKKIEDITIESLQDVFYINTCLPILWLKHIKRLVRKSPNMVITVFSARVGSIEDNRSGGWYSYRSSKAALNMLLKCCAIEFHRINKNVKLLAFHPGTVDTPLSSPFQKNVPAEKLFHPDDVAQKLDCIIKEIPYNGELSYLDWAGKPIPF